jgi:hypothetical protein
MEKHEAMRTRVGSVTTPGYAESPAACYLILPAETRGQLAVHRRAAPATKGRKGVCATRRETDGPNPQANMCKLKPTRLTPSYASPVAIM